MKNLNTTTMKKALPDITPDNAVITLEILP